jgi:hypothetical protein
VRYLAGAGFEEHLGAVEKNVELWQAVWQPRARGRRLRASRLVAAGRVAPPRAQRGLVRRRGQHVPVVARLAERCPNLDLRVLARDANPDIMDAHLTGRSRSIPVIIVLDEAYRERGWWGPRPTALQRWVSGQGQLLEKTTRYREARTWYARDRGRTTLEEVVSMLERAARARVGPI